MSSSPARRALEQRVAAALALLGLPPGSGHAVDGLAALVAHARDERSADVVWLTLVAATGALPDARTVRSARLLVETTPTSQAVVSLLATALTTRPGATRCTLDPVPSGTVVQLGPGGGDVESGEIGLLLPAVLPDWTARAARVCPGDDGALVGTDRVVVPWRSTVLVVGSPAPRACAQLAALAEHSGNRVAVIVPSLLPVAASELGDDERSRRLGALLELVKHAHVVLAPGAALARAYAGFAAAVRAQGLPGPRVVQVSLDEWPAPPPTSGAPAPRVAPPGPALVSVADDAAGQLTVLAAAERLWAAGLAFRLRLAAPPLTPDAASASTRLRRLGHDVAWGGGNGADEAAIPADDDAVAVWLSGDGWGLLVRRALAAGLPAVVSAVGAGAEVATSAGCRAVDPGDDEAVLAALRTLLGDPVERARLATAARRRPAHPDGALATELWAAAHREAADG